ncbi:MAG: nucleotide pyrophosphatase [Desulfobacteraceae bacterium]|nr:MAG: nucleotide pyrophosphatase [Desulfobacteraceae bacterium]
MKKKRQRIVIGLLDGLGVPAFESSSMPFLKKIALQGFYKTVSGVFPSVTNVNNVSICCGTWPDQHGITANSYFNPATGAAEYMNAAELIRVPTLFERAAALGLKSALLTSKRKTAELFTKGTEIRIAAETAAPQEEARYGKAPDIYSADINYWLWQAALDLLATRPDLDILYVHTTDFPMHAWSEKDPESLEHLLNLDRLLENAARIDPDAALFFTADHGMNFKSACWDLEKVCRESGLEVRFVLSPERDYYIKHHRNFTGCSWIWLKNEKDREPVKAILRKLSGVEQVLDASEAARRFHIDQARIGDLVVLGDCTTMFGEMDRPFESLPSHYRAHGSLYEMELPLIIWNYRDPLPKPDYFQNNFNLTSFLFPTTGQAGAAKNLHA